MSLYGEREKVKEWDYKRHSIIKKRIRKPGERSESVIDRKWEGERKR